MSKLLEILARFKGAHLLVVGDLMLDRFVLGDVERLSPEAPVPVLRVVSEDRRLGGAANVVHNIRSLGGRVTACGIIGNDDAGKRILGILRRIGASTAGVLTDRKFQTIQKSRIIASPHHQQIVRLDRESREPIHGATLKRLREFILDRAARCDGVLISDYGKGVVHAELLSALAAHIGKRKILYVVDPKKENFAHYRYPTLITPNRIEAADAAAIDIRDDQTLLAAGAKLLRQWRAQGVLITRGAEGMSLFQARCQPRHFPTAPREVFEVTGAGDTVVAVCGLVLACGGDFDAAAVVANVAAGFVGDEIGTVAVPFKKLKQKIEELT
ncbi:MAG: PfkB family carbohydrate kinase [Candidatus Binatota bacterium]|nr:PfkB family carbohydrate kinase [Candidatus Binatota bacterium]